MEPNSVEIDINESEKRHKNPPHLVYCGDGVIEEYSDESDTEEEVEKEAVTKQEPSVDPKSLDWIPWVKYYAATGASKGLAACDFMGEKLAWWFGITKPKYLYEIEEYNRMQQEMRENDSDTEEIEMKPAASKNSNVKDDKNNTPTVTADKLFQA